MSSRKSKGLSHSVLNASEEAVENPCGICISQQQKQVESTNYCVECDSNMCNGCTKWHANFPSMKSHKVVDISRAISARKTRVQLPTQRCEIHNHKFIERFCRDHDELACDSCVSQDHRKCDNLEYIPAFSKGVKTSRELVATTTSTESVLKALKEFQSTQHQTLQKLDTAELQCQQALQDHRDKLHKRIDELAKTDSVHINSKFQGERAVVNQSIKAVDAQIETMEMAVKGLKQSKGDNESELFVYMKQGEKTEKESQHLLHTQQQSHKQIPKYILHGNIEKSICDFISLGEFEEATRLDLRGEYNVRTASDKSECDITGACLLPDASLMITDANNKSLKQLESSYMVTRSLYMGTEPYDVCYTSCNEVAVTLVEKKTIQFVCVGASLKKTRSVSVGSYCKGIACSNGELFVCCENRTHDVRVFNLAGKPLRTIQYDPQGQLLFTDTRRVTVSSCGNKLYVTDVDKGLFTTDRYGNLKQQFHYKELINTNGICELDSGDLLVGGFKSNNVLHVSRDGRTRDVVLGKRDGLVGPRALVFDPINSRIIVTTLDSDTIKAYDVM